MRTAALSFALTLLLPACGSTGDDGEPKKKHPPNKLAKESSPYLLQHARNPVQWYPWGPEAFEKAEKEDKLIFLSIGYSSCHWCHVMERESFEDEEVADILNKHFVPIKVDREERPDVDEIYMTALQVLNQRGGWPLSMFLTPEGKPIFGGTYWPKDDKIIGGQTATGFITILKTVLKIRKERPEDLKESADQLAAATAEVLSRENRSAPEVKLDRGLITSALGEFADTIDPEYGGFGRPETAFLGTKFPMPAALGFVLDQAYQRDDADLKKLVNLTLHKMAGRGIYDHLGGGFHRYSTERTWTVPHFEKMLYDNGQLVEVYARAFAENPDPTYRRAITETLEFIDREMTSPEGAFYSALDADSEGKEGEFYVWTEAEIDKILSDKEAAAVKIAYGSTGTPNFEEGKHILVRDPDAEVDDEVLAAAKEKLFQARAKRERPFRDTKILTSWNGLMIGGYAVAGKVLEKPEYVERAERAAEFVLKNLRTEDGRLLRTYATTPEGKEIAKLNAYLDDYAFLIHGLLNLHEATGDDRWLGEAKSLADTMIEWYHDGKAGGFFFTSHDHEKLFARSKMYFDGAEPSGNSVAVLGLLRLAEATGSGAYREKAEHTLKKVSGTLQNSPTSSPAMLAALDLYLTDEQPEPRKLGAPEQPGGLRKSDGVVKVTASAADGALTVTIKIDEPYHIYANPVGAKLLAEVATTVRLFADDKPLEAWKPRYPEGTKVEDDTVGDYLTYEGEVKVTGKLPEGVEPGDVEVRVSLQACTDRACLLPATVKTKIE